MPKREPLTPEQRSLRARIAAHSKWAATDPIAGTESARASSPGTDTYWLQQVDPNHLLSEQERYRRATSAKRAHFARLALASSKARRKGAADAA